MNISGWLEISIVKLSPIWLDLKIMRRKMNLIIDGKGNSLHFRILDLISDMLWFPQLIQVFITK